MSSRAIRRSIAEAETQRCSEADPDGTNEFINPCHAPALFLSLHDCEHWVETPDLRETPACALHAPFVHKRAEILAEREWRRL